jgi:transcriptional regulator with XRE-family HTH domain
MPAKTNLSKILKDEGRTNIWLSKKTGKSVNTIALWTTGKVSIPLESLYALAEILNVTIYDLLPEKMIYVKSVNQNSASKETLNKSSKNIESTK